MSVRLFKLYGVPLSQPFRSVAWTMLQLKMPFKIEMAVPGMSSKIGTKHDNFRSLTPYRSANVPLLAIGDNDDDHGKSTVISESPAIMTYLCEQQQQKDKNSLYASPGTFEKAKIDSYMHWHHDNTRFFAKIFQTKVRPDLKIELSEQDNDRIQQLLESFDSGWLRDGQYIGGMETPTIADILAYGEISTVTMTKLLNIDNYSNLHAWTEKLSKLPYHKEAHTALSELGNLNEPSAPIPKLLGAATKAGMKALADAQESFAT